jgi:hypothetical protein
MRSPTSNFEVYLQRGGREKLLKVNGLRLYKQGPQGRFLLGRAKAKENADSELARQAK